MRTYHGTVTVPAAEITVEECASTSRCVEADLGFALGVLSRRYQKMASRVLSDVPGGARGYLVLTSASTQEPRRQLTLAQDLGIDRTVMTYLLDDLEQAGFVERRPDPADRRARLISVTEDGLGLIDRTVNCLDAAEDEVLGALPAQDRTVFRDMLQRLTAAATEAE